MPRRPRLAVPGIPWHIIQRGNNRDACFYDEMDYRYYLQTLEEQADKYRCCVRDYVKPWSVPYYFCKGTT